MSLAKRGNYSRSWTEHKILQALDEHGPFVTQAEWARYAGVHAVTLSYALSRKSFLDLYHALMLRRFRMGALSVVNAAIEVASRPEHTSATDRWRLLETIGLYTPKTRAEVSGSMQVDFASLVQGIHAEPPIDTTARELPPGEDAPTP